MIFLGHQFSKECKRKIVNRFLLWNPAIYLVKLWANRGNYLSGSPAAEPEADCYPTSDTNSAVGEELCRKYHNYCSYQIKLQLLIYFVLKLPNATV